MVWCSYNASKTIDLRFDVPMTVDICRWHLAIPTNKLKPSAIFVQGKQAQPLKGNGYLLRMDMLWLVVLHQHQVHTCRGSWYQKNTFLFGGHVWPILKGAKICWLILTDFRRSNIPFPIRFPLHPWKWTVFEFISKSPILQRKIIYILLQTSMIVFKKCYFSRV